MCSHRAAKMLDKSEKAILKLALMGRCPRLACDAPLGADEFGALFFRGVALGWLVMPLRGGRHRALC